MRIMTVAIMLWWAGGAMAQSEMEISIDSLLERVDSVLGVHMDLKEFDWVDICENPKYAIVTKNGKKGVYDLMQEQCVTKIEYDNAFMRCQTVAEDSSAMCMFSVKKGYQIGLLSVAEADNTILSIWIDDPSEVLSLDACTTIDEHMMKKSRQVLKKLIEKENLENAQVVVLDAQTGHLRTWVSLERQGEHIQDGKLLAHSCVGALTFPFRALMALNAADVPLDEYYGGSKTYFDVLKQGDRLGMRAAVARKYGSVSASRVWEKHENVNAPTTNPMVMAVGYNCLPFRGEMYYPTLRGDTLETDDATLSPDIVQTLMRALRVDGDRKAGYEWLPSKFSWIGHSTMCYRYADEDKEHVTPIGSQVLFAGYFPVETPKYTICVVANTAATDCGPEVLKGVVEPLSLWLEKR